MKSPALQFIEHAWNSIPHTSWQRLNGGMYSALSNAVGSGMKFDPNDLKTIAKEFRSGYWMGDGEGLYAAACGGKRGDYNLSAAIAFETYWGRKAWLWSEECKTAKRLHVGERFTWKGHLVTITSFDDAKQSLTACTYKEWNDDVHYIDGEKRRLISERIDTQKCLTQRWSAPVDEHHYETSKIAKRFTITFDELQAVRKAADARVRKHLKAIAAAQDVKALEAVWKKVQRDGRSGGFRHFDVEALRAAYAKRPDEIQEALRRIEDAAQRAEQEKIWKEREEKLAATHDADLERWLAGEEMERYFNVVRLRIKDEYVETSTNQRATVAGARQALRFIRKHRACGWKANGEQHLVDQFPIKSITKEQVVVGCTTVPMSEVERIGKLLAK